MQKVWVMLKYILKGSYCNELWTWNVSNQLKKITVKDNNTSTVKNRTRHKPLEITDKESRIIIYKNWHKKTVRAASIDI